MKLKLLQVREASGEEINFPQMILEIMGEERKADRECFWVLHLNGANKVIEKELVSMGSVNSTVVHPREIYKKAITNGATSIITVHNHPSNGTMPSEEDLQVWDQLNKAGDIIGIKVLDHCIITPNGGYYSKSEKGK